MTDLDVPSHWKSKTDAAGAVIPECWTTPGGYTVARHGRPIMPVAVIRAGRSIPFAYVHTLSEVPTLIAADLQARMTPEFRAAFNAINRFNGVLA